MPQPVRLRSKDTRWVVRIIPFFIAGAFGFATYVAAARLCVNYIYRDRGETGVAAALLTLHFLFLALTLWTYVRTFVTVQLDPALVPLPPGREVDEKASKDRRRGRNDDPEANPWTPPDPNPDSPGLEAFYSKEAFICEADGRPKWCSECTSWKPDRAHHSSELGRCVRKLDHVCPWVGGMVSETSFNFFVQFTFYTTLYCAICLAAGGYSLQKQQDEGRSLDGFIVAVMALAGFFSFFTLAMTATSGRFLLTNTTNIDMLRKSQVYQLAIRIPRDFPSSQSYQTITYPLTAHRGWSPNGQDGSQQTSGDSMSARDELATRTFAIIRTEADENPWDLGYWRNFKSVMGNNIVEWLLPIRHSPCCSHESMEGDYEFGPLLGVLGKRFGLPGGSPGAETGMEMHNRRSNR